MLEVCVDCLESALNAIQGGADELELCSSLWDGGLTPTPGMVKKAMLAADAYAEHTGKKRPKINVLLRCRAGADFCYNKLEMDTMLEDLRTYKDMGVDRFVFGCLNQFGEIDSANNKLIVEAASPLRVTFHRAFDVCTSINPLEAIRSLNFDRLLTSGKCHSVDEDDSVSTIRNLLNQRADGVKIMPGGGVTCGNAVTLLKLGCKILHSSCKILVAKDQPECDLGMAVSIYYITDVKKVENLKGIIEEFEENRIIKSSQEDTH